VVSFIFVGSVFVGWQKLRSSLTYEFLVFIIANVFSCYLSFGYIQETCILWFVVGFFLLTWTLLIENV